MSFIAHMFGGGGHNNGPDPAAQAAAQKAAQEAADLATQQEGYRRKQAYGVAVKNTTKDTIAGTRAGVGTSSGLLSYDISEQQKPTTLGG